MERLEHKKRKHQKEIEAAIAPYQSFEEASVSCPADSAAPLARPQMESCEDMDVDRGMSDEEDAVALERARNILTVDEEKQRLAQELEDFGEYGDEVVLPVKAYTDEDDATVPDLIAGLGDMGMYFGFRNQA
jgi:hypothetical protein